MKTTCILKKAAASLAAGTGAGRPIATGAVTAGNQVRMASSFRKASTRCSPRRADRGSRSENDEGKFEIRVFAAGEICARPAGLDAVQNERSNAASRQAITISGRIPAFAFDTAIPFWP